MDVDDLLVVLFLVGLVAAGIEGLALILIKLMQYFTQANYLMFSLLLSPILLSAIALVILLIKR